MSGSLFSTGLCRECCRVFLGRNHLQKWSLWTYFALSRTKSSGNPRIPECLGSLIWAFVFLPLLPFLLVLLITPTTPIVLLYLTVWTFRWTQVRQGWSREAERRLILSRQQQKGVSSGGAYTCTEQTRPVAKWVQCDGHAQCYKWSQLLHNHYLQNVGQQWEALGPESLTTPSWLICSLLTPLLPLHYRLGSRQKQEFGWLRYGLILACIFSSFTNKSFMWGCFIVFYIILLPKKWRKSKIIF